MITIYGCSTRKKLNRSMSVQRAGCARTAGLARGGRDGAMIGQIGAADAGGSADSRAIQPLRAY
jgi:hypothetical protein